MLCHCDQSVFNTAVELIDRLTSSWQHLDQTTPTFLNQEKVQQPPIQTALDLLKFRRVAGLPLEQLILQCTWTTKKNTH